MNINRILSEYFKNVSPTPTIEMFDEATLFSVYKHIISTLQKVPEIEQNVVKGLAFCLYEILDNVITHSNKRNGIAILHFDKKQSRMRLVVADDGVGIWKSMSQNPVYKSIDEPTAITMCIQKNVTDGNGMGFGLFSTSRLVTNAGICMKIHSGSHSLTFDGLKSEIQETRLWQGTIVYLDLHSNVDFDPDEVAKDCTEEYDEMFLADEDTALW